ncbi:MAG: histone deacetylase family protein, partial [Sutterella sp.]
MTSNLPLATGYFTHDLTSLTNPIKDAPETPDRLASIELMLMAMGFGDQLRRYEVHEAPLPVVHLAHDPSYVQ